MPHNELLPCSQQSPCSHCRDLPSPWGVPPPCTQALEEPVWALRPPPASWGGQEGKGRREVSAPQRVRCFLDTRSPAVARGWGCARATARVPCSELASTAAPGGGGELSSADVINTAMARSNRFHLLPAGADELGEHAGREGSSVRPEPLVTALRRAEPGCGGRLRVLVLLERPVTPLRGAWRGGGMDASHPAVHPQPPAHSCAPGHGQEPPRSPALPVIAPSGAASGRTAVRQGRGCAGLRPATLIMAAPPRCPPHSSWRSPAPAPPKMAAVLSPTHPHPRWPPGSAALNMAPASDSQGRGERSGYATSGRARRKYRRGL